MVNQVREVKEKEYHVRIMNVYSMKKREEAMLAVPMKRLIVENARKWIGEKEIPGNKGFFNKTFEALMLKSFWRKRDPWCADFKDFIWWTSFCEKYTEFPDVPQLIKKLASASSQRNFRNYQQSHIFQVDKQCAEGAAYMWGYLVNGKLGAHGHTGTCVTRIVSHFDKEVQGVKKTYTKFYGIEGNNKDGVREVLRTDAPEPGKIFLGYIHPKDFDYADLSKGIIK